jgi:hypothetical protein
MSMAVGAGILIVSTQMAILAVVLTLLAMIQGEDMDAEARRKPGLDGVAAAAIQSKLPNMNDRLLMASRTVGRRASLNRRLVATLARLTTVPARQQKDSLMVERHHRIVPIMAFVTSVAIEHGVLRRKMRLGRLMAGPARQLALLILTPRMASFTEDRTAIITSLVIGEAEVRQPIMLKSRQVIGDRDRCASLVFGMATAAILTVGQATVQSPPRELLLANIDVATFTAIGRTALPWRMTPTALGFEVGVGCKPGQRFLAWAGGRQPSRAKRSAAKMAQEKPQNQYHHDCRSAA